MTAWLLWLAEAMSTRPAKTAVGWLPTVQPEREPGARHLWGQSPAPRAPPEIAANASPCSPMPQRNSAKLYLELENFQAQAEVLPGIRCTQHKLASQCVLSASAMYTTVARELSGQNDVQQRGDGPCALLHKFSSQFIWFESGPPHDPGAPPACANRIS